MRKPAFFSAILLFSILTGFLFTCKLPAPPSLDGENHKPQLIVPSSKVLIAGETLILGVSASDPDINQTVTITADKKPANATFSNDTLRWTTTLADAGVDTIIFIARDNGTLTMADTDSVYILVSATAGNRPPEWNSAVVKLQGKPGEPLSLDLNALCTDPDKDILSYTLKEGSPAEDTITNSTWSFTPEPADTGIFTVSIIATDPKNESATLTLELTIAQNSSNTDKTGPKMNFFSPSADNQTVSLPNFQVTISCKDESGIAKVTCSMGSDTFAVTNSFDTLYSALVTNLKTVQVNTIQFIAIDKAPAANRCTLNVSLKYDPAHVDKEGPVIRQTSGPITGSSIDYSIIQIVDSIIDQSSIDTVYWTLNGGNRKYMTLVNGANDLFILKDTLHEGKFDTIAVTAVDKSTNHNPTTQTIILKYCKPPIISSQPISQTVCPGSQAVFSVNATGTAPLQFLWRKGSGPFTNIGNARTPSCTLNVSLADNGTILTCIVSNASGIDAVSKPCTLSVSSTPSKPSNITASPSPACPNTDVVLSASGAALKWYTSISGTPLPSSTVNPSSTAWYFVRSEGSCGNSAWDSVQVVVNSVPAKPTNVIASPSPACPNTDVVLSASGAALKWYTSISGTPLPSSTVNPSSTAWYFVRSESSCGNSAWDSVQVIVNSVPAKPTNVTASPSPACPNTSVNLSASGTALKWYSSKSGTPLSSSTVNPSSTAWFFVRSEGSCGNSAWDSVQVIVNSIPAKPTNVTASPSPACPNTSVNLSASGTALKWYSSKSGTPLSSTTVNPLSTAWYFVRAEGTCGNSAWDSVQVVVNSIPAKPTNVSVSQSPVCPNISVNLSASGTALKWYNSKSGTPLSSLTVSPSSTAWYFVRAEGTCGNSAWDSVQVVVSSIPAKPTNVSVSKSPVCPNTSVNLSASGTGLKWYGSKSGTPLSSSTVSPSLTAWYFVRAEGTCGNSAWDSVLITVNPIPTISRQPVSTSFCVGSNWSNFSVIATGTKYQWKKNGTIISDDANFMGTTTNRLSILNSASNAGTYTCEISNGNECTVTTNPAQFTQNPLQVTDPVSLSLCEGQTGSMSVTSDCANSYKWYFYNGDTEAPVATGDVGEMFGFRGAETSTLIFTSYTASIQPGDYFCVVSNGVTSARSNIATLSTKATCP